MEAVAEEARVLRCRTPKATQDITRRCRRAASDRWTCGRCGSGTIVAQRVAQSVTLDTSAHREERKAAYRGVVSMRDPQQTGGSRRALEYCCLNPHSSPEYVAMASRQEMLLAWTSSCNAGHRQATQSTRLHKRVEPKQPHRTRLLPHSTLIRRSISRAAGTATRSSNTEPRIRVTAAQFSPAENTSSRTGS